MVCWWKISKTRWRVADLRKLAWIETSPSAVVCWLTFFEDQHNPVKVGRYEKAGLKRASVQWSVDAGQVDQVNQLDNNQAWQPTNQPTNQPDKNNQTFAAKSIDSILTGHSQCAKPEAN